MNPSHHTDDFGGQPDRNPFIGNTRYDPDSTPDVPHGLSLNHPKDIIPDYPDPTPTVQAAKDTLRTYEQTNSGKHDTPEARAVRVLLIDHDEQAATIERLEKRLADWLRADDAGHSAKQEGGMISFIDVRLHHLAWYAAQCHVYEQENEPLDREEAKGAIQWCHEMEALVVTMAKEQERLVSAVFDSGEMQAKAEQERDDAVANVGHVSTALGLAEQDVERKTDLLRRVEQAFSGYTGCSVRMAELAEIRRVLKGGK